MNAYTFVIALLVSIIVIMLAYHNSKYYIDIHTGTRYKIIKEGYGKRVDTNKYEYYYVLTDGNSNETTVFINELHRDFIKVIF